MSQKPVGIVRFLGTNCDRDVWQAVAATGGKPEWLWYTDQFAWQDYSALILPGGFSYGDYLRCGALAARANAMKSVREAATKGVPILGICNGFQILCEAGLLPGVLTRNLSQRFADGWVDLIPQAVSPQWAQKRKENIRLPIAHGEGRFYIDENGFKQISDQEQIWFRYAKNPNGSQADIAGVLNKNKNVAGLMPHPERAIYEWMGCTDGLSFFNW